MTVNVSETQRPAVIRTRPLTRPLSTCIDHGRHHDIDRLLMSPSTDILFYDPRAAHPPGVSTATVERYTTHKRRISSSARSVVSLGRSGFDEPNDGSLERERNKHITSLYIQTPKFTAPVTIPQGRVVSGIDEKMVVPDSVSHAGMFSVFPFFKLTLVLSLMIQVPPGLQSCASTDKEFLLPLFDNGDRSRQKSPFPFSSSSWASTLKTTLIGLVFLLGVLQFLLNNPLYSTSSTRKQSSVFQRQEREFARIAERCYGLPGITAPTYLDRLDSLQKTLNKLKEQDEGRRQIWMSEPSATSAYFTSISKSEWSLSERPFLFMVESSHEGDSGANLKIFTPHFEEDRARILPLFGIPAKQPLAAWMLERKQSAVETVVKGDSTYTIEYIAWQEDESPYAVLAQHIESSSGLSEEDFKSETVQIHLDPGVRAFVSSGIAHEFDSRKHYGVYLDVADPKISSLRERKSAEEIELLECANHVSS
jgi:hypothetical protein